MKIMLRAALAALSFASIGSAYADSEGGQVANTQFTQTPGLPRPGSGAERPGRRDSAERPGGAGLRHPVEPRHLVPGIARR